MCKCDRQAEILELSLLGGLVAGRLEAAAAALAAAARAWKGARDELGKRLDEQLKEQLEGHGHDTEDVAGELTCMLASGRAGRVGKRGVAWRGVEGRGVAGKGRRWFQWDPIRP